VGIHRQTATTYRRIIGTRASQPVGPP